MFLDEMSGCIICLHCILSDPWKNISFYQLKQDFFLREDMKSTCQNSVIFQKIYQLSYHSWLSWWLNDKVLIRQKMSLNSRGLKFASHFKYCVVDGWSQLIIIHISTNKFKFCNVNMKTHSLWLSELES